MLWVPESCGTPTARLVCGSPGWGVVVYVSTGGNSEGTAMTVGAECGAWVRFGGRARVRVKLRVRVRVIRVKVRVSRVM